MNSVDIAIINLKLISKIPEYGRIRKTSDNLLVVEDYSIFSGIKRYFSNQNRMQNIYDVVHIIDGVIEKNYFFLDNKNEARPKENIMLITRELKASTKGLEMLKNTTYKNDYNITSIIELTITKIKNHIIEIERKLGINIEEKVVENKIEKFIDKEKQN
jgi:hypothetical protein